MHHNDNLKDRFVGATPKEVAMFEDRHIKVLNLLVKYTYNPGLVLDLGCGDGNFTKFIKEVCMAKDAVGIEISKKGAKLARLNGISVIRHNLDGVGFPFKDESFDVIFAGEVIEHIYHVDLFLQEVYRVLKNNGIFILTTPNLAAIHNRISLLLGYQPFPMSVSLNENIGRLYEPDSDQSLDHIRVMTLRSILKLLELYRFRILKVYGSCARLLGSSAFIKIIRILDKLISYIPSLSYRVVIACVKY